LRVVDDDLTEVLCRAEGVRREDPDLDEVVEVAEAVELSEPLNRLCGELETVPLRDLEQPLGPNRGLEMDVKLDLGVGGRPAFPGILHSRGAYRVAPQTRLSRRIREWHEPRRNADADARRRMLNAAPVVPKT
jgi:hypothetical protein